MNERKHTNSDPATGNVPLEDQVNMDMFAGNLVAAKGGKISRREFLKLGGPIAGGLAIASLPEWLTACADPNFAGAVESEATPKPTAGGIGTLVPTHRETTPSPTDTAGVKPPPSPEATQTLSSDTYPVSSANFTLVNEQYQDLPLDEAIRTQSAEVEKILLDYGLEGDIDAVKELYIEELMRVTGESEDKVAGRLVWEYHLVPGKSWLAIPRDKDSGRFWMPIITDPETGGTGRKIDLSLTTTLGNPGFKGDFFDLKLLDGADGLGETKQVIYTDTSTGWFAFGEASKATKEGYVWYNMKQREELSWTPLDNFKPQDAVRAETREVSIEDSNETKIEWIALNNKETIGWRFDPQIQTWVEEEQNVWDVAPDELDGYSKSNFSTIKPNLIIYRDEAGDAQLVLNTLNNEKSTLLDAGIAEFDFVKESDPSYRAKGELLAFVPDIPDNANPETTDAAYIKAIEEMLNYIKNDVKWGDWKQPRGGEIPQEYLEEFNKTYLGKVANAVSVDSFSTGPDIQKSFWISTNEVLCREYKCTIVYYKSSKSQYGISDKSVIVVIPADRFRDLILSGNVVIPPKP